jgi:predicted metal-dependent phosphoesterase TrpH
MKNIPPACLRIQEAITLIHAAGGAAVLAHPATGMVNWRGSLLDANALGMLVEMGLDGIEVYHFRLDEPTRAHFLALAYRYNLVVTGGSDDHGWPEGFPHLASQPVGGEVVSALSARTHKERI